MEERRRKRRKINDTDDMDIDFDMELSMLKDEFDKMIVETGDSISCSENKFKIKYQKLIDNKGQELQTLNDIYDAIIQIKKLLLEIRDSKSYNNIDYSVSYIN